MLLARSLFLALALGTPPAAAQGLEFEAVDHPGNPAHPVLPGGSIPYTFEVGKTEVTNLQYHAFLTAVAADDPHGLYNTSMESAPEGGILRSGPAGSYVYTLKPGLEDHPVNFVSFWDACRFCNWLHNGQASGSTETGAYTLTPALIASNDVVREPGALFALPTREEWWKMGYYDHDNLSWFVSPAQSLMIMSFGPPALDDGNTANCATGVIEAVGSYTLSVGPYGTFDMGGNVREWVNRKVSTDQEVHGDNFVGGGGKTSINAANNRRNPTIEEVVTGFRVLRLSGGPEVYCTAGTSASGCQAQVTSAGVASATAGSGFTLTGYAVEGQKDGLFFFGTGGRQANPWGNGSSLQCVVTPVKRGGVLAGNGTAGACDGVLEQDLNALWCPACPSPAKNPGPGALVQAQLWYRDPLSTSNQTTSLSSAIEFPLAP